MDVVVKLLIFLHFMGLVVGMGSGMALSNFGRASGGRMDGALLRLGDILRTNAHVGLALLWITGLLMVWLRYGGIGGLGVWFWLKMAGVVVLSAAVGMSAANYRKLKAGDADAPARAKVLSAVTGLSGVFVVLAAVFAFD